MKTIFKFYTYLFVFALLGSTLLPAGVVQAAPQASTAAVVVAAPVGAPLTAPITPTLTVNTVGTGAVVANPPGPSYPYGATVSLTPNASTGWSFSSWTLSDDWWDANFSYRADVFVSAAGYARTDKPVDVAVNFTNLLVGLGVNQPFDPDSVRVVEVNTGGQLIDSAVPSQFDRAADYNPDINAAGTVTFMMKGNTAANAVRTFHLYFDVEGKGFSLPVYTDQVEVTSVTDDLWSAYRIATKRTPNSLQPEAVYTFQQPGGGFSHLLDANGNDWIKYRRTPSQSGGDYRGIPNSVTTSPSNFHPGRDGSTSTLFRSGPLKETIKVASNNGKYEAIWEIYPSYARMTLAKMDTSIVDIVPKQWWQNHYWFLYEGTPGGDLNPGDFGVKADGTQFAAYFSSNLTTEVWEGDMPAEEWVYLSDGTLNRSIYTIHEEEDNFVDSYKYQKDAANEDDMTVVGFGRQNTVPGAGPYLSAIPQHFMFGLMDTRTYSAGKLIIQGSYRPLNVTLGNVQSRPTGTSSTVTPLNVTLTANRVVTATFVPQQYTLSINPTPLAGGTVIATPAQAGYIHGTQVQLQANPAPGYSFTGWGGGLTGLTNPATLTMDSNKTVTVNFTGNSLTLAVTPSGTGAGVVSLNPQPPYVYGQQVTLTATPNPGSAFAGWGGALGGNSNPITLIMDANKSVTVNWALKSYKLGTGVVGQGSVTSNPSKATYSYNEAVTLTATPATGWSFSRWSGGLSGTGNPVAVNMDANKTAVAVFTQNLYTLQVVANGNGTVNRSPAKSGYPLDSQVTLTAQPALGFVFTGWSGGGLDGAISPNVIVTISGNMVVTANFAPQN